MNVKAVSISAIIIIALFLCACWGYYYYNDSQRIVRNQIKQDLKSRGYIREVGPDGSVKYVKKKGDGTVEVKTIKNGNQVISTVKSIPSTTPTPTTSANLSPHANPPPSSNNVTLEKQQQQQHVPAHTGTASAHVKQDHHQAANVKHNQPSTSSSSVKYKVKIKIKAKEETKIKAKEKIKIKAKEKPHNEHLEKHKGDNKHKADKGHKEQHHELPHHEHHLKPIVHSSGSIAMLPKTVGAQSNIMLYKLKIKFFHHHKKHHKKHHKHHKHHHCKCHGSKKHKKSAKPQPSCYHVDMKVSKVKNCPLMSHSKVADKGHYFKKNKKTQAKMKIRVFEHSFHDLVGNKHKIHTHHHVTHSKHHSIIHTVKVKKHSMRHNREYEPLIGQEGKKQEKLVVPPHVYHQNVHFFAGLKGIHAMGKHHYHGHKYECWSNVPQDVAFDPKYYGEHRNVLIEVPKDRHGKKQKITDHTRVIFCVRNK